MFTAEQTVRQAWMATRQGQLLSLEFFVATSTTITTVSSLYSSLTSDTEP